MAMVPLKCPKCGAVIQLDDQQKTGTCQYCEARFPFREAVRKYMAELAGKLVPDEEPVQSPVIFTTTTTTTVNGETTTVNGQEAGIFDVVSKLLGAQTDLQGFSSEPIPGYDLPEKAVMSIRFLVTNGQKIQAIKVFRQLTNVDLKEAKDVIDRLDAGHAPQDFSVDHSGPKTKYRDPNVKVSRCYIATAVYGSYDAPQVIVLRRFRDEVLSKSFLGRAFIRTYYAISPSVAKRLENAGTMNRTVRRILDQVVRRLDGR